MDPPRLQRPAGPVGTAPAVTRPPGIKLATYARDTRCGWSYHRGSRKASRATGYSHRGPSPCASALAIARCLAGPSGGATVPGTGHGLQNLSGSVMFSRVPAGYGNRRGHVPVARQFAPIHRLWTHWGHAGSPGGRPGRCGSRRDLLSTSAERSGRDAGKYPGARKTQSTDPASWAGDEQLPGLSVPGTPSESESAWTKHLRLRTGRGRVRSCAGPRRGRRGDGPDLARAPLRRGGPKQWAGHRRPPGRHVHRFHCPRGTDRYARAG